MKPICLVIFLYVACAWASAPARQADDKDGYAYKKTEVTYERKTGRFDKDRKPQVGYDEKADSYKEASQPGAIHQGAYQGAYQGIYQGRYGGKCVRDGLYYQDSDTFVICSNKNAYVQPCAPGSRNSGYDNYVHGKNYGYRDFCDVNLVAYGYTAHHGYKGGLNRDYDSRESYAHRAAPGYGQIGYGYGYGYGYGQGYAFGDNHGPAYRMDWQD